MSDSTRLDHIAIIEDAYRRESNWRRRKEYMMFAHTMMHYADDGSRSNSSFDTGDIHRMRNIHTVFGMRHIHESIVSYL